MPHTSIRPAETRDILDRIARKQRVHNQAGSSLPYSGQDFETDVKELLDRLFPFSTLAGLRLFSATHRLSDQKETGSEETENTILDDDWGFEIDHLFHFRCNADDFIVLIETKNQPVTIRDGRWEVEYDGGLKCAKEQVTNHIKVLWEYLEPISHETKLSFIAIVCSSEMVTPASGTGFRDSEFLLSSVTDLPMLLESILEAKGGEGGYPFEVFRVRESGFLNLLRMSLPIPELGHPELSNSIRYVERCRRNVDEALFRHFEPKPERWVINGSAGMGKSVLLAYTAAVLATGRGLARWDGSRYIHTEKKLDRLSLDLAAQGKAIVVIAMSGKQLDNLQNWFLRFIERFRKLDQEGNLQVRQPEFLLCRDSGSMRQVCERASAMLVDEAHDLREFAATEIAEGHKRLNFYLVVACDRHQKLRLSKDDTRIIKGLDFTNKSKRLKQIYRNPISIYIASLALMFRWGAKVGPKVMPNWKELREWFGFKVDRLPGQGQRLSIESDAHPANSWSHCVVMFPSAGELFDALESEGLSGEEILWVRFSEEDPNFNYEKLSRFTYHNCRTFEAQEISDKYVKGQEFPVVVIEGFPSFVDQFEEDGTLSAEEEKMWSFRREIYLCASRATCFLYFLCNPTTETPEKSRFRDELKAVVDGLATPMSSQGGGTRKWSMVVSTPSIERKLDVFDDTKDEEEVAESKDSQIPEPTSAKLQQPEAAHEQIATVTDHHEEEEIAEPPVFKQDTVPELATALGIKPFQLIQEAMGLGAFLTMSSFVDPELKAKLTLVVRKRLEIERAATIETKPQLFLQTLISKTEANAESGIEQPTDSPAAPKKREISVLPDTSKRRKSSSFNRVDLSDAELAKLPPMGTFQHTISIEGPLSVMELARNLGVPHWEVINEGTRLKHFLRGGTMLGPNLAARIAATRGFGIEWKEKQEA